MWKIDVIRLLGQADVEYIEQISRDYPGLTDLEREELFHRIELKLQALRADTYIGTSDCIYPEN